MKIDRFNLYMLMTVVLAIEAALLDARNGTTSSFYVLFGLGPERFLAAGALRIIGFFMFRDNK